MNDTELMDLLERTKQATLEKFRQELIAQNEDLIDDAIKTYKSDVARHSWRIAQKWCKWELNESPVLMPDKTRLYYRRGETEVVLQEHSPQVRHIKLVSKLLEDKSDASVNDATIHSFSLALPYINFVYVFKKGLLEKTLITFCDRPLKTLEEKPMKPYLSNINDNMKLCHGSVYLKDNLIVGNITQQISYTLDVFWQTVYLDEWSSNFWNYKNYFKDKDARLASISNWQEATLDNPLFVIEDVEWMPYNEEDYGSMLASCFDYDAKDNAFQQELFQELSSQIFDNYKQLVNDKINTLKNEIKIDFNKLIKE